MKTDIIKAISDPNLFLPYVAGDEGDLTSWRNWLAFLRVLYGQRLPRGLHEVVRQSTGRDPARLAKGEGYSETLLLCGRRSGKSKVIALVGAAEAVLSGREQRLSAGEIGMVAILSPTRFQSRIIHEYLRGVFDSTPLLQREVVEEKREGFKLENGVEVQVVTGDPRSCRGFSLIACIVDEIAMFGYSEESKVKSDTELIRSLRPSLATTGGRLICVGTPYAAKGHAFFTFKRAYGNDASAVLCWNAASTVMNPTLNPAVVQRAIDEDPIAASVEYCVSAGLFREDIDEFISRAAIEALVVPGRKELPPISGIRYAAFADVSGGKNDDACLAIAHKEDRVIVLDCLERHRAPHNPYEVVGHMCATLNRYDIEDLLGDAYSAEWARTAFHGHGINYRRSSKSVYKEGTQAKTRVAKPKSVLYSELLPRLHSGELELLDNETLIAQLASLQRRTRSGARDSIDHPPGGHDDCANVVAGVCDAVMQRPNVVGPAWGPGSRGNPEVDQKTSLERAFERLEEENIRYQQEQERWRNENPHAIGYW